MYPRKHLIKGEVFITVALYAEFRGDRRPAISAPAGCLPFIFYFLSFFTVLSDEAALVTPRVSFARKKCLGAKRRQNHGLVRPGNPANCALLAGATNPPAMRCGGVLVSLQAATSWGGGH